MVPRRRGRNNSLLRLSPEDPRSVLRRPLSPRLSRVQASSSLPPWSMVLGSFLTRTPPAPRPLPLTCKSVPTPPTDSSVHSFLNTLFYLRGSRSSSRRESPYPCVSGTPVVSDPRKALDVPPVRSRHPPTPSPSPIDPRTPKVLTKSKTTVTTRPSDSQEVHVPSVHHTPGQTSLVPRGSEHLVSPNVRPLSGPRRPVSNEETSRGPAGRRREERS